MRAYSHEVAEMALAHAIGNAVERAYRRGDLFEKRRRLMADLGQLLRKRRSGWKHDNANKACSSRMRAGR